MELEAFVLSHLPPPPARVLEVGCGAGDLARTIAERGHAVVAIDPAAPTGSIFRPVPLEEFHDPSPFDAVVASNSLHHVHDLRAGIEKIAALLRPGGVFVVDDYAKERVDRRTAEWYFDQRRALAEAGGKPAPASFDACVREWKEDEAEIHTHAAMREELDRCLRERGFAWVPYLFREFGELVPASLEQDLIDAGAINATGFRYVGERPPSLPG